MVKDEVPVFFEEEEDYSDPCDLHGTPITVPPPRIWHLPRLKSGSLLETSPSQAETSPSGRKKRRPNTVPFLFTPEQEKELAEWYRDNPRFYNKRCREFRLAHVKRRILENKAKEYVDEDGNVCSFLQLSTWMSNMRTYYGKLGNIPNTGFRTPDHKLTEREQWIKEAFSFLSDHIVRIKSRRGVTLGKKVGSPPGSQTGSQAGGQAERISSDAGEDDVHVQATISEAVTIHTKPGTSTGSTTPQGKGDRSGVALTKTKEQMKKSALDTVDIKTIERVCAKILEKGAVQPTAAPDSPHSAELNDFARTIVSSMRRIPEERWNDVKTDIMLVVRNYSTPAHSKGAAPSAPASATQYPMGYWPPAPPAHAPLYDPNAVPGYNYPSAPGHGYYRPPSAPATGPPMYPPVPPHMHPAPQQGPQFVQPSVPAAVAAPTSTTTTTAPSTTAATSATSTSAFSDAAEISTPHDGERQISSAAPGHSGKNVDSGGTGEKFRGRQCSAEQDGTASNSSNPPMKLYSMELCKVCKKTLYVTDEVDEDGNPKVPLCDACRIRDSSEDAGEVFNCDVCSKRFAHFRELATHMKSHRTGKTHQCEECLKCFSDRSGLLRHQKIHSGIKPHQCEICSKCFTLGNALKVHMRTHNKDKPFTCEHCDKTFAQSGHLRSHMQNHSSVTPFGCKHCSASFPKLHLLKQHLRNHGDDRPFKCDICTKAFNRKSHLKTHLKTHSDERPHQCEICSKTFADQRYLNKHLKVHSGVKPYKCEYCDHRFSQQCYLQTHLMIHTGTKPYACHLCPKSFRLQEHLKTHLRVHSGSRPFECGVCSKRFTRKDSLGIHMRIHTGDYRYKCEVCSKGFTDPSSFRAHVRSHSGVRPYSCTICGKSYTQNSSLKVHMLSHTNLLEFTNISTAETSGVQLHATFPNSTKATLPVDSEESSCVPLDLSIKRVGNQEPLNKKQGMGEDQSEEDPGVMEEVEGEDEQIEGEPENEQEKELEEEPVGEDEQLEEEHRVVEEQLIKEPEKEEELRVAELLAEEGSEGEPDGEEEKLEEELVVKQEFVEDSEGEGEPLEEEPVFEDLEESLEDSLEGEEEPIEEEPEELPEDSAEWIPV